MAYSPNGRNAAQAPSGKWSINGGRLLYDGTRFVTGLVDDLTDSSLDSDIWTEEVSGTEPTTHAEGANGYVVTTASGSSSIALITTPMRGATGIFLANLGCETATVDGYDLLISANADATHSVQAVVMREGADYKFKAQKNNGGSYNSYGLAAASHPMWMALLVGYRDWQVYRNTAAASTTVPISGWVLVGGSQLDWSFAMPASSGYPRLEVRSSCYTGFPAGTTRAKHVRWIP